MQSQPAGHVAYCKELSTREKEVLPVKVSSTAGEGCLRRG